MHVTRTCTCKKEIVMDETQAATLEAIRKLQRHPGNPWREELQALLARAQTREDITVELIDLLRQHENVRRWMREQIDPYARARAGARWEPLFGRQGNILASQKWVCSQCDESLPVIQEGEDPPTCEVHGVLMVRGRQKG
jgi:hypothetical protein